MKYTYLSKAVSLSPTFPGNSDRPSNGKGPSITEPSQVGTELLEALQLPLLSRRQRLLMIVSHCRQGAAAWRNAALAVPHAPLAAWQSACVVVLRAVEGRLAGEVTLTSDHWLGAVPQH